MLICVYDARNNRHRLGGPHETSPLLSPRSSGSNPAPPPYEPPSGRYQANNACLPQQAPSPRRPAANGLEEAAITKRRGSSHSAILLIVSVVLLIVLAQAVAFIFCCDLPSKLDEYAKTMARMREQRGAMREEAKHLESEQQLLEKEKEELREERERLEKARAIRIPYGAFWDSLTPAPDCRAYGKREYRAALQNIPENRTDVDACMSMPAEIKDVVLERPHRCGYVIGSTQIHGFWMVDWDQPDCKPWHQDVTDTVSSGGTTL